jgi:hypothetical protein
MTDIKELALRVAKEMYCIESDGVAIPFNRGDLVNFASRLIAAYLAEQEPVGYFHKHQYGDNCVVIENVVDSAKDEEGVFPLYVAPQSSNWTPVKGGWIKERLPGSYTKPAPQQEGHYKDQLIDELDSRAAPSSEEVREMVENLRSRHRLMYQASPIPSVMTEAADLIERLAAAGEVKP